MLLNSWFVSKNKSEEKWCRLRHNEALKLPASDCYPFQPCINPNPVPALSGS